MAHSRFGGRQPQCFLKTGPALEGCWVCAWFQLFCGTRASNLAPLCTLIYPYIRVEFFVFFFFFVDFLGFRKTLLSVNFERIFCHFP